MMQKKIEELNQKLITNGQKELSLNPTELSVLQSMRKHLESSGATKSSQDIPGGLDLAIKLSTIWPYSDRLPGLDLLRLLAVAPMTAEYSHPRFGNIVTILSASVAEQSPPAENHVMMAIRAFVNLFESPAGRALAASSFNDIQSLTTSLLSSTKNRNLLVAATTLWINYAVLFTSLGDDEEVSADSFEHSLALVDALCAVLKEQNDSEVVYRAMVALGTVLSLDDDEVTSAAKDVYGVESSVQTAVAKATDPRIKNVAAEIRGLLK